MGKVLVLWLTCAVNVNVNGCVYLSASSNSHGFVVIETFASSQNKDNY